MLSLRSISLAAILACTSLAGTARAGCIPSLSCALGNQACDAVCVRQGNPNGGHCVARDGCPGMKLCACFNSPQKRSDDEGVIDGDAHFNEILERLGKREEAARKEGRSISCSIPTFGPLLCEDHCAKIGRPGGECSPETGVCTCN
ncbi:334b87de-4c77-406e-8569-7917e9483854 [Thermothielavioides terrestris]|jgi:hypothetical protein|uniref:Invertebrate defensins family profile domain-containing protein n=2 Tax=Thermothielavioides terrestris TaxID=2587410 RepID=G2R164_THETT|nr:uncharacterized protein THITE_2129271 [Thermothielavioides terrestris NRRL 8126]AEO67354.1 hypothetical protein THITE_2129271 [Thermothielavioides terrestris NRRL 8126]SPQ24065.1 334b87de-4c77-406e-8569-7917e9483854 [Thermothielavioides terrestris]